MYGERSERSILLALLDEMSDLGADTLEAQYSGGNDEGGVQDLYLYKTTPKSEDGDEEGGRVQIENENALRYDSEVWSLCDELLSTKYYSWAGDFSAWGTLFVSAAERRAWTQGSETQEVSVPDSDSINIRA